VTRGTTARAEAGEGAPAPDVLALPHTDWLYHHLRITGAPAAVAAFRAAAAGAGVIPWQHDLGPAAAARKAASSTGSPVTRRWW